MQQQWQNDYGHGNAYVQSPEIPLANVVRVTNNPASSPQFRQTPSPPGRETRRQLRANHFR